MDARRAPGWCGVAVPGVLVHVGGEDIRPDEQWTVNAPEKLWVLSALEGHRVFPARSLCPECGGASVGLWRASPMRRVNRCVSCGHMWMTLWEHHVRELAEENAQ